MSEQQTPSSSATETPTNHKESSRSRLGLSGTTVRNLGLVAALVLLCLVGLLTGGDRFASVQNLMIVLSLASVTGVLAIGMTFVITTGGIDLSVGSVLGLTTVWASTLATQTMADQYGWIVMVGCALLVGLAAGLVNGVIIAYGNVVAFIATLAMLVAARGLAELIANRRTQIVDQPSFESTFQGDLLGVPKIVWIFVVVAIAGWFLLNRTTFGRRTVAIGGNREAARLAGINVKRHLLYVYGFSGLAAGIGGVMMLARTGAGSSTNGLLMELDVIAMVVVGGTLLAGGRGTIIGTIIGVLIFATLQNVFIINNVDSSVQQIARGAIIVAAVLLQQRFAGRSKSS
ncbi:ABC transporter permease [Isoptericola haloaureus]|uniref:ABC transporter permease n=1 Tax=Isoptericola haloaureus TaxID=1542902 RepID=UPI00386032F2